MSNTEITPEGYPQAILKGDVLADAYNALKERLIALLPADAFAHVALPPHPTKTTWEMLLRTGPTVALGFAGWRRNNNASVQFRGDLSFPLAITLIQNNPADLYLGNGQLRGMGVLGVQAALAGGLDGWTIPGIGTCFVRQMTLPDVADWFSDRNALIAVELVVENVELNNRDTLALLHDFISQQNVIEIKTGEDNG